MTVRALPKSRTAAIASVLFAVLSSLTTLTPPAGATTVPALFYAGSFRATDPNGSLGSDDITGVPSNSAVVGAASASYNVLLGPPSINESVAAAGLSAAGNANISLFYYFFIAGTAGIDVPITVSGLASSTIMQTSAAAITADLAIAVRLQDGSATNLFREGSNFLINDVLHLTSGNTFLVELDAQANASGGNASVNTLIDPIFTVDSAFANDFHLIFSDGVINSAASATPLPAALPLFAGGLGVIGLLTRRRKKRHVAA